ncbi:hypothetical protein [Magnetospira sp. QH-2]|uniref:hypothetical protein n=1 Tax=Magnetospira sp. (strain QH-2) TaxID=1288970 RepID=UPI0003E80A28|nr:hypothetical protein [Magnetospira sp. QH-2]CCQ72065.1 protein of unknown function [Magnetospira sp. QH-2]
MPLFIAVIALLLGTSVAQDQAQAQAITQDLLFQEAERRAIEHFFGAKAKTAKQAIEAAKAAAGVPAPTAESDREAMEAPDDDDEDEGKGKGKNKSKKNKAKKNKGHGKGKGKGLPPGLAKRDSLPPGLAKHVEKHGKLPPGLSKSDLPNDLSDQLPPPPVGTERQVVDNDVVLIEKATGTVLDVLYDVVTKGKGSP